MRRIFLSSQIILLLWFFLDMIGVYFNNGYLVTRSYKDDGIFFLIYSATVLLFVFKEKIGMWVVTIWSVMWFVTQFINHELVTITGNNYEGKSRYFEGSLKWLDIEGTYVPDLYHTILHVFILAVIILGIVYIVCCRKKVSDENRT